MGNCTALVVQENPFDLSLALFQRHDRHVPALSRRLCIPTATMGTRLAYLQFGCLHQDESLPLCTGNFVSHVAIVWRCENDRIFNDLCYCADPPGSSVPVDSLETLSAQGV